MAPTRKAGKKAAAAKASGSAPAGKKAGFAKADWADSFKKKGAGVSDMTLLSTISNESINENLKKRFENREIYTYIGHVLISVNPFQMLPIYTLEVLRSYKGKNRLEMPPHVYAIAESMYYNMNAYGMNQCVIISGESGAGKTEAAKKIMEYIADVSGEASDASAASGISAIKDMVLATNPLLEAFGCAKTLRNNNSSRHGKYLEIEFGSAGEPVGAMITNYLLEKGRIVRQIDDERNFHIFYQFTKHASPEQRETFGIQTPASYFYTSRANCLDVPGIDDGVGWAETLEAMNTIGITGLEQASVLRMLATVLWLGNAQYRENAEGNAEVSDDSVSAFVAYLLEVEQAAVIRCLTTRTVETQRGLRRGSVYEVPMNKVQAEAARDALSKAIYNNLFEWIVDRINRSMKARAPATTIIGVLDIYGFEIFESNSFEQLCINYVNERLQQIFIELTLKKEQEEYEAEQISWTPIKFFNNKIVCDLIDERRPPGIFAAMNDATATAHADSGAADNSFMQRMGMLATNPHFEARGSKFLVKHYAGDVLYDVVGMTDKNKDALGKDLLDLVAGSGNSFVQELFPDRIDPNSKKRPPTQGDKIKASANALVEKLMRSQPSYIRTIKPNQNKSPSEYDSPAILHQIKYLGLQENIRIRRAGFAYRNTFEAVVGRFYLLSSATGYAGEYIWTGDYKAGCERIFKDVGIAREEWQLGVTKAFIKNPETLFALEHMRDRYWHNMAARIQRAWRNYVRYKNECATRIQRAWKANKVNIVWVQRRDYGHQIYAGRKERRRFSILGSRKFFGDYLDVGDGKSAVGEMLRSAGGISPAEHVAFSARGSILVSKLGRSSKPSPRFLIVTDKALYILITQLVQGRSQTTLERKVNLVTVSSVGLTNLRDDWIAINVSHTEEPDPVLSCIFKTEMVVHMMQQTGGSIKVNIGPQITYRKKKDKMASIKAQLDQTVQRDDVYKSSTIHVPSGEPSNSVSMPLPPRKPGPARSVKSGRLLQANGPEKPRPAGRPLPGQNPVPRPVASLSNGTAAPARPTAPATTISRTPNPPPAASAIKASAPAATRPPPKRDQAPPPPPPPPPPPAPAAPAVEQWKVLYEFTTSEEGELSLKENDLVEVLQQSDNGWWLVKKNQNEGWAPAQYLKKVDRPPPPTQAAPIRRAPPAAPTSAASTTANLSTMAQTPSVGLGTRSADGNAQPIAVMPSMGTVNGLAALLVAKRTAGGGGGDDASSASSAPVSRTSTPTGSKVPAPPPKPKPAVAAKPGGPAAPPRPGAPAGQLDLAAALAKRAGRM